MKAMHLLQSFGSEAENHKSDKNSASPLQKWVSQNGIKGWNKWRAKSDSIEFPAMKDHLTLNMHADQVKKLEPVDVLSQVSERFITLIASSMARQNISAN